MSSRRFKTSALNKAYETNPELDPVRGVSQNDVLLTPPRSNSKQSDKLLSSPRSVTFNNNISNKEEIKIISIALPFPILVVQQKLIDLPIMKLTQSKS